jgi:hypothetical protein
MKAIVGLFAVVMMATALSLPALAQEAAPAPRVIHNGNTDIVFESATTADLNIDQYRAFDRFAGEHREIAQRLSTKPSLVNSQKFLGDHPELAQFMNQNPEWRSDFEANPGNYLPLAPGVERATMESTNVYPD